MGLLPDHPPANEYAPCGLSSESENATANLAEIRQSAVTDTKPNILFILADKLGHDGGALRCAPTPCIN